MHVTTTPIALTPQGTLEGWQDEANRVLVSGWAWDRATPDAPVAVAIYDGRTLLTTVIADAYRRDLQAAGIGDGRHAFICPLERYLRDRKPHHITVQIAGTNVVLRDVMSGAMPQPVYWRDRPRPAPIPHFSLPPMRRWFSYSFMPMLLHLFPYWVWRVPAVLLGIVHLALDQQGRALNVALSQALGRSMAPGARWRLHWSRAYQRQANLLMIVGANRVTPRQAERLVRFDGTLPAGGAILVSIHHDAGWLASRMLMCRGYRLGVITTQSHDPVVQAQTDATLRAHWRVTDASDTQDFGDRRFPTREAGRKGLRLLADGGYLMVDVDEGVRREPFSLVLGRVVTVPRGAVWFARRSGKPIIPYMVVPEGMHWRLWVGEPVAPTQEALCAAMEECIRRAPGSWQRFVAMAWMEAPHGPARIANEAIDGPCHQRRWRSTFPSGEWGNSSRNSQTRGTL